jgi:hypothetical protein
MATGSAVLQLRTQFLHVLSRLIEALHKPFESLQFAAEPRQGACRHSHAPWLDALNLHIDSPPLSLGPHSSGQRALFADPTKGGCSRVSRVMKLPFSEHGRSCVENDSRMSGA